MVILQSVERREWLHRFLVGRSFVFGVRGLGEQCVALLDISVLARWIDRDRRIGRCDGGIKIARVVFGFRQGRQHTRVSRIGGGDGTRIDQQCRCSFTIYAAFRTDHDGKHLAHAFAQSANADFADRQYFRLQHKPLNLALHEVSIEILAQLPEVTKGRPRRIDR